MFIVSISPRGTPEQLDSVREAHYAWATKGFVDGLLLAGGRLVPPTGGMLFTINDRAAVDAFVAEEPFQQMGLADIIISEIHIVSVASGLEKLKSGQ